MSRHVVISRDKRMQWRIHFNPGNGKWANLRQSYVTKWNAKRAACNLYGADIRIEVRK